jgi:hypothetical protein
MNIVLALIKFLLGLKFGWVIVIVLGVVIGGSLIRNIFTGSFSVGKFLGGFNIFTGSVQGKLIYYGLLAILAFGLYHQLTRATVDYNTDYRNNVHHNRDVYLDQRVGDTCTEKCAIAIQPFGFTILKVGCVKSCTISITQTTKVEPTPIVTKEIKKLNPLSAPLRWISKLFKRGK